MRATLAWATLEEDHRATSADVEDREPGECVAVFARADFQAISGVPGCDEVHHRPPDPRTGLPVPIWELSCPGHEAWICGDDKQKILVFEPNGKGGFTQHRMSPMQDGWSKTVEGIPLTPDQLRAETSRNALTRRAEMAMLQEGIQNTRLALECRPTARELLKARALAARGTIQQAVCHSCQGTHDIGVIYCPWCAVRVSTVPADVPAEALAEPATVAGEA
jgi:hypothetical protein